MVERYDAGLINDFGGGNVEWWQDYIRAEIERANDFHADRIAALEAQLAEAKGKLNEIACWSQSQGLLWWQVKAREALSALEATPPAPKVTEADMEWLFEFRENWVNDGSRPDYQQMAKAYAAKMHPWEAAASIYEGRFEDALTAAPKVTEVLRRPVMQPCHCGLIQGDCDCKSLTAAQEEGR